MIKGIIIAVVIGGAFFAWTLCKAAGDADDMMGTRDE
jgi:hypothetical protein